MKPHPRPLEGEGLTRRIAPFVFVGVLAFAVVPLLPGTLDREELVAAAAIVPALVASPYLLPWARLPAWAQAVPPLAYFLVVVLMRDAEGPGPVAFTPLVLLPVFWFALHGTRRQLVLSVVALTATLAGPLLAAADPPREAEQWARVVIWVIVAGVVGYTVQALVRQREELLARVSELALTDPLTGLPNRRAWAEELPRAIARASRWESPVCVAVIDLDRFKDFNDARGHPRGDLLLKEAAAAWRGRLREVDFLARYGGEEFAVILPDCELEQAVEVIERVRRGTPGEQTSSSGVACWNGSETLDELLLRADLALYAAKGGGRDRTAAADAKLDAPED